jgi:hypothetical protein
MVLSGVKICQELLLRVLRGIAGRKYGVLAVFKDRATTLKCWKQRIDVIQGMQGRAF